MKSSSNEAKDINMRVIKKIEELENEVKICNYRIQKQGLESCDNYSIKAKALVELGKIQSDTNMYNFAVNAFSKAIELSDSVDKQMFYLSQRAKVYVDVNKTTLAVKDFEKIEELRNAHGTDITSVYNISTQATTRDLKKLKSVQGAIKTLADEGEISAELASAISNLTDVTTGLVVKFGDHDKSIVEHSKEIEDLKEKIKFLEENIKAPAEQEIMSKVLEVANKFIEPSAFKVLDEISSNPILSNYYSALYSKLDSFSSKSKIVIEGQIALDTSDPIIGILCCGLSLIPVAGKALSKTTKVIADTVKSNNIKNEAIKFNNLINKNPDFKGNVLKKLSESITLNKRIQILDNLDGNEEVLNWQKKGLKDEFKDFFIVNCQNKVYVENAQILGCVDALKIIFFIINFDVTKVSEEDLIRELVDIPNMYTFSEDKKISQVVNHQDQSQKEQSETKCLIFTQNSIIYDKPLLNNPNLLKPILTKYSLSQILDLSTNIDESLINDALSTNNPDILLAGLMSVDTTD